MYCKKNSRVSNDYVQTQLEKRLVERGGQFMVGNNFTWADLHLFFFCSEEFMEPKVVVLKMFFLSFY